MLGVGCALWSFCRICSARFAADFYDRYLPLNQVYTRSRQYTQGKALLIQRRQRGKQVCVRAERIRQNVGVETI